MGINMNIIEFEQKLYNFLNYETHQHRHKRFEIDYNLVIGYLNYLSKVHLNNCYEFDYDTEGFIIFLDCYDCNKMECAKNRLGFLLKEFKKLYRCGF
jgi:hypothetical protein